MVISAVPWCWKKKDSEAKTDKQRQICHLKQKQSINYVCFLAWFSILLYPPYHHAPRVLWMAVHRSSVWHLSPWVCDHVHVCVGWVKCRGEILCISLYMTINWILTLCHLSAKNSSLYLLLYFSRASLFWLCMRESKRQIGGSCQAAPIVKALERKLRKFINKWMISSCSVPKSWKWEILLFYEKNITSYWLWQHISKKLGQGHVYYCVASSFLVWEMRRPVTRPSGEECCLIFVWYRILATHDMPNAVDWRYV